MEKIFEEHVKKGWKFSERVAKETLQLQGHIALNVSLAIFEKYCSPYFYFLQDKENSQESEKPTEKQIAYAKKLDISNPESYTKKTLSSKIDEVANNG